MSAGQWAAELVAVNADRRESGGRAARRDAYIVAKYGQGQ
jgi:hypothetical protein